MMMLEAIRLSMSESLSTAAAAARPTEPTLPKRTRSSMFSTLLSPSPKQPQPPSRELEPPTADDVDLPPVPPAASPRQASEFVEDPEDSELMLAIALSLQEQRMTAPSSLIRNKRTPLPDSRGGSVVIDLSMASTEELRDVGVVQSPYTHKADGPYEEDCRKTAEQMRPHSPSVVSTDYDIPDEYNSGENQDLPMKCGDGSDESVVDKIERVLKAAPGTFGEGSKGGRGDIVSNTGREWFSDLEDRFSEEEQDHKSYDDMDYDCSKDRNDSFDSDNMDIPVRTINKIDSYGSGMDGIGKAGGGESSTSDAVSRTPDRLMKYSV